MVDNRQLAWEEDPGKLAQSSFSYVSRNERGNADDDDAYCSQPNGFYAVQASSTHTCWTGTWRSVLTDSVRGSIASGRLSGRRYLSPLHRRDKPNVSGSFREPCHVAGGERCAVV